MSDSNSTEIYKSIPPRIDLSGSVFLRLTVISYAGKSAGKSNWLCVCVCGIQKVVRGSHLTGGKTRSCGCLERELTSERSSTHGLSKSRPYRIWRNMINRCHYEKYGERHLYGGRGIAVCDAWRLSFEAFIFDMGMPDESQSIDRIDVNGNYEPGIAGGLMQKPRQAIVGFPVIDTKRMAFSCPWRLSRTSSRFTRASKMIANFAPSKPAQTQCRKGFHATK